MEKNICQFIKTIIHYEQQIEKFRNQLTSNPKFDGLILFGILDRFRTGFIRQNEIYEFMKFKKAHVDLNMARVIFNFFDVERNGCLSYQEFIQGILPWRNYIFKQGHDNLQITLNIQHAYNQEARLVRLFQQIYANFLAYEQLKNDFIPLNAISAQNIFNYIDVAEQGFLDHLNLDEFLRKNGEICTQQDIDLFIRFADTQNNKRIDKSELNFALNPQLDLNTANYLVSFQDKINQSKASPQKFQQKNLHYQVEPLLQEQNLSPERVVSQENGKEKIEIMKKTVNFDDYEKFEHKPKFINQVNQQVQNQIYERSMRVYDGGSLSPQKGSPSKDSPKKIQRAVTPVKLQRIGLQENYSNYSKYNKSAGKSHLKNPKLFNLYFRDYENKKSNLQYENVLKKSAIKNNVSPVSDATQLKQIIYKISIFMEIF